MMSELNQELQNLLYAYALGCLDRDDFEKLIEHLESSESFPWQELGEYQNLAALLPSFLNVEEPSPGLKDKVARKLYRLKDVKKTSPPAAGTPRAKTTHREKEKLPDAPQAPLSVSVPESVAPAGAEDEIIVPKEFSETNSFTQRGAQSARPQQQDTQVKARSGRDAEERQKPAFEPPADTPSFTLSVGDAPEETPQYAEEEFVINQDGFGDEKSQPSEADLEAIRKKVVDNYNRDAESEEQLPPREITAGVSRALFYSVAALLAIAIFAVYYLLSADIKKRDTALGNALRGEITKSGGAQSIVVTASELLRSSRSQVITLLPENSRERGFGRLILDVERKEGFLVLAGLPATAPESGYQLWMESGKQPPTGLGLPQEFAAGGSNTDLFPLALEAKTFRGDVTFYVTMEKSQKETPAAPNRKRLLQAVYSFK
jgi:hypothetical protein